MVHAVIQLHLRVYSIQSWKLSNNFLPMEDTLKQFLKCSTWLLTKGNSQKCRLRRQTWKSLNYSNNSISFTCRSKKITCWSWDPTHSTLCFSASVPKSLSKLSFSPSVCRYAKHQLNQKRRNSGWTYIHQCPVSAEKILWATWSWLLDQDLLWTGTISFSWFYNFIMQCLWFTVWNQFLLGCRIG